MIFILLHRVYIIFGLKFRNISIDFFLLIILLCPGIIISQQIFNDYGFTQNFYNRNFRMNSLESNINNFSTIEDWELSLALTSIVSKKSNINLKSIGLGKRIDDHYFYMRFTPNIKQEFIFNSRTEFLFGDSIQSYKTNLQYSEKYGLGYSYNFSKKFSFGISLRYFQQKFDEEYPSYFSNDTTNIIQVKDEVTNKSFWRGDIGIQYFPIENLGISLSTTNLFILKDYDNEDEESEFEIKTTKYNLKQNKGLVIGVDYLPNNHLALSGKVESNSSFIFGLNYNFRVNENLFTIGSAILHDKYQLPYIAGILPSLSYSNNLFSITLSYLKYFNDRNYGRSLYQFKDFGIHSIQNNFFNPERLNLNLNFALSFKIQKQVKFIDLNIHSDIFPTFQDNYIDHPIATGTIVNLTSKAVSIKPSCYINNVTSEKIYSPIVNIQPSDTAEVSFFIIVGNEYTNIEKTQIANALFYLTTISEEPDDEIQKPILIHGRNNWDGTVRNLRYFVKAELEYSNNYAKSIINELNLEKDKTLETFETMKLLFNEFAKNINYVSDRRATVDYVQFPKETIDLQGGDCDDLSVCLSSLFESIGIQTAFIDYKPDDGIGHVSLLLNTKLTPNESSLITINERKFLIRKNYTGIEEVWIPLEVTSLTNFNKAWELGANKFYSEAIENHGLAKNNVEIVEIY